MSKRRLSILLSAYACEPAVGSEPGIGWRWATELCRAGHRVHVITRANNRDAIQAALAARPLADLTFSYCDLPAWARWWKRGPFGVHLYYALWQRRALAVAHGLAGARRFDLVHHVTFGVYRQPSWMGELGLPFVFGPVGGGEATPTALRATLRPVDRVREGLRELANRAAGVNPLLRRSLARATVILCKTDETLGVLPEACRARARVFLELGVEASPGVSPLRPRRAAQDRGLAVLFVGRLIHWKGAHLALRAVAEARARQCKLRFTVLGTGRDAQRLRDLADSLGLADSVSWVANLPYASLQGFYRAHDVLLFPSLHDSSGNVVLEALAGGLPVVCLAAGGPRHIVDEACAFAIPPSTPAATTAALASALCALAGDDLLLARMSRAAVRRAQAFTWERRVAEMGSVYAGMLGSAPAGSVAP